MTIWPHRILPADEAAPPGNVWLRPDGTQVWVPADDPTAPEAFLNHSCDPNVWLADEVTLVARRAIPRAQELTIDYALFELDPRWISRWQCQCRAVSCRGSITGRDFEIADLQARYGQHFHPEVLRRIRTIAFASGDPGSPPTAPPGAAARRAPPPLACA